MPTLREIAEQVRDELADVDTESYEWRVETHGRNAKRVWTDTNDRAERDRMACRRFDK